MTKFSLQQAIERVIERGDRAFISYVMAGDGGLHRLIEQLTFLQDAGATAIEIGIPFSDPVADGHVIQAAGTRALSTGVTLKQVLELLKDHRDELTVPLIIMTYMNPIFQYDVTNFAQDCVAAHVQGVIVPDVPLEESALIGEALRDVEVAHIQLVSLTSPLERREKIARASQGFLYAVAVTGITGARSELSNEAIAFVKDLKTYSEVPVLTGFGISTPEQVRQMGTYADGVIVGSRIVQAFHDGDLETVRDLVQAASSREVTS